MLAAIAHNLLRWTQVLGAPGQTIRTARTLRRRWLTLPGRLTRTARRWTLHLPARWPWRNAFTQALQRIRALQPAQPQTSPQPRPRHTTSATAPATNRTLDRPDDTDSSRV